MFEYLTANIIWLIIGLVLGVIVTILFSDRINNLKLRWKLYRGKAVKGLIVKGYFTDIEKQEFDKNFISGNNTFIRPHSDKFRMYFELKLPYEDISDRTMSISKSDDIIRQAYYKKYRIRVDDEKLFPINGVSTKRNMIFPISELDYNPK